MLFGNIIKCGRCGCEYDADKNNGCPQCEAGKKRVVYDTTTSKY
jgi:hypothetical protein